jgi:hypothetical protein
MAAEKQRLIFISYSSNNRGFALELAQELKASGFRVWFDQLDIPKGSRWDDEIEKALSQCEIFLVILTKQSIESHNVKDEVGYAIDSNKRILPILLEEVNVPFRLRRFQYVDFTTKSNNEGIDLAKQLLRTLMEEAEEAQTEPSVHPVPGRQPEVDRSEELQADAHRLAQRRAEAIRRAREMEQMKRSSQAASSTPSFERIPSQPQPSKRTSPQVQQGPVTRRPVMLAGGVIISLLCLGVLWGAWAFWPQSPTPTRAIPTTVTPSFTPIVLITTVAPPTTPAPTTPAPPSVTIPSDPADFIRFYFDNINSRKYDLTWSLLTRNFQDDKNPAGQSSYEDFWNQYIVEIYSVEYTELKDSSVLAFVSTNISSNSLPFYIRMNTSKNHWEFDLIPSKYDYTCQNAPISVDVGFAAQVATASEPLSLRNAPTDGTVLERMPPGTMVSVLDGPECKYYSSEDKFFWWWKVESSSGLLGWVVDGYDAKDPAFLRSNP